MKNTKSDILKIEKIDIAKTKWPVIEKKLFFLEAPVSDKVLHSYPTLGISVDHPQYPNRFYKRDTANNYKNDLDEVEMVSEKSFILENLIENLIRSSFGPIQNDTELDLSINVGFYNNSFTTTEPITLPSPSPSKRNLVVPKMIIINETTNVVSINNTDENIDNNKYTKVAKEEDTYKNVYNEMITKLSKHIDNQNNHSMELMEQILGHRFFDIPTSVETTESQTKPMVQTFTSDFTDNVDTVDTTETTTYIEKEIESKAINNTINTILKSNEKMSSKIHQNIPINQRKPKSINNSNYNSYYRINTNNTHIDSHNQTNNNNFQRKSRQRFEKKLQNSKKITVV